MSPDPGTIDLTRTIADVLVSEATAGRIGASLAGALAGVAGIAAFSVPAMARLILPPPKETRLADHLPLDQLQADGRTIVCRDGTLVQCIVLEGRDIMFLSAEERDSLFRIRKNWLDAIAEIGVTVRVMLMRERVSAARSDDLSNPVLKEIARRWNRSFQEAFANRQVIVLSTPGKSRAAAGKLAEAVDITLQTLAPYQPRVMYQTEGQPQVPPPPEHLLAFWGALTSPISRPVPHGRQGQVSDVIATDTIEFTGERGVIRFSRGPQEMFCAAIGIRRFGDHVDEQMISDFSGLDGEMVLLHLIEPWSKTMAAMRMTQEKNMSLATRLSQTAGSQYDDAIDIIEGLDENRAAMATYSMVLFLFCRTTAELDALDTEVRKICSAYGAASVREGAAAQASWFSLFPSYSIWPRAYRFFSSNIATNITLDRPPTGTPRCDWGDGPLSMFRTAGGTSYSFQLHVSADKDAVGHAVCIGPTGSGKTTVISFLAGMAMRHPKLRTFIFDRYHGAYTFTTAVGGAYLNLVTGESALGGASLNPFQCADSPENRAFLRLWLRAVSGCDDADSLEEIGLAIKSLFDSELPLERRSLATIYDACFSPTGTLKRQLLKWVDPAYYGKVFNSERDTLNIRDSRLVTFDMTDVFKDEQLAQATVSYLMHRIQTTISELNAPAFIFIDETEPMLKNPMFRAYYLTMLQEYRKRGAAVISAFQRPEAIAQQGMGEAIRGQCQTMFFFPNPQAREEDYADWSLTDTEWSYIKGNLPVSRRLRRSVLIKRATGESVVLDTDLSPLGPYLRLFSSGRESVSLAMEMQKKLGQDWVKSYVNHL